MRNLYRSSKNIYAKKKKTKVKIKMGEMLWPMTPRMYAGPPGHKLPLLNIVTTRDTVVYILSSN